jgi:hypothetical protein
VGYGPLPPPIEVLFLGEGTPTQVYETVEGVALFVASDGALGIVDISEAVLLATIPTVLPAVAVIDALGETASVLVESEGGASSVLFLDGVMYNPVLIVTEDGELVITQTPMIWVKETGPTSVDLRLDFGAERITESRADFDISNELSFSTQLKLKPWSLDSHIWVPKRDRGAFSVGWDYFVPTRLTRDVGFAWATHGLTLKFDPAPLGLGWMTGKLTKHQRDLLNFAWYKYPLQVQYPILRADFTTTGVIVKTRDLGIVTAFYNWDNVYFGYRQDMGILVNGKADVTLAANMGVLKTYHAKLGLAVNSPPLSNLKRTFGIANRTYGINIPVGAEFALSYTTKDFVPVDFTLSWDMLGRGSTKRVNLSSMVAREARKPVGLSYSLQYTVGRKDVTLHWWVERRLTVGRVITLGFSVLTGAILRSVLLDTVRAGAPLGTPMNAQVMAGADVPAGLAGVLAGAEVTLPLNLSVIVGYRFIAESAGDVRTGVVVETPARDQVTVAVPVLYDLRETTLLVSGVVVPAPAVSTEPLVLDQGAVAISMVSASYPDGLLLESVEVSADEGSYGWAATLTLADPRDLSRVTPNETFTVQIGTEEYVLLVESKTLKRESTDTAVKVVATIKGMSPAVQLTAPRANQITKTWEVPAMASEIIAEVIGGVVPYRNELLDWAIPAYRLGVSNAYPMDVLAQIATAVGGMVCSDPDGTLVLQSKFKTSVPNWGPATADQQFFEEDEVISVADEYSPVEVHDKFRVMDTQTTSSGDRLEFEKTDADSGLIRAYPSPWRTTVVLETTAFDVTIGQPTEEYRDEEATVEVYAGEASVQYPIISVNSVEWLDVDLQGVIAGNDSTRISTTHPTEKFSMLKISYKTRCLVYPVDGQVGSVAQFLLRNP